MNAWNALHTVIDDGWVLRVSGGYTKRANAVHPLYPSHDDPQEKIERAERFYHNNGLPAIFKITQASHPSDLEQVLEERGYRETGRSLVLRSDLKRAMDLPHIACDIASGRCPDAWSEAFSRFSGLSPENRDVLAKMLAGCRQEQRFLTVQGDQGIAAVALGIVEAGEYGIYDVVVDPAHRGQGYGRGVIAAMLEDAGHLGCGGAYLQVVADNEPAIGLYRKMGFETLYCYWYRIASDRA